MIPDTFTRRKSEASPTGSIGLESESFVFTGEVSNQQVVAAPGVGGHRFMFAWMSANGSGYVRFTDHASGKSLRAYHVQPYQPVFVDFVQGKDSGRINFGSVDFGSDARIEVVVFFRTVQSTDSLHTDSR